jgi:TonB family protein
MNTDPFRVPASANLAALTALWLVVFSGASSGTAAELSEGSEPPSSESSIEPPESPEPTPEPSEPGASKPEVELAPPELVEYVEAEYPKEAFEQQIEADVMAEIDIDATGAVTDVRITEPVGHGFDEAARAAMMKFKFKPALKDGEPTPARVTYRYQFFIKEEAQAETEAPAAPLPSKLMGTVLTMTDEPIPGAFVTVVRVEDKTDAKEHAVETDISGRFELADLAAGKYRVQIASPGYKPYETEEIIEEGEERELIYRLEFEEAEFESVVRAKRPPREVTRRVVTQEEITKIAGTGGDALRAVQNLPGVARAPGTGGQIAVRGSAPYDTAFFFDSLNLPMLYHFGDMTSVINSDLIESIEFYPGNFSVKYGRATGGVIDVKSRAPKTDRLHAYIDADLWDVGLLAEGPIGEHWSVAGTVRRSYIDGIMKAANLMGDEIKLTVAPRYYDFQLVGDYHPSKKNNLRLFFYGTDDKWVMSWDDESDPFWGNGLDVHLVTYQGQAEWKVELSDTLHHQLSLGAGYWGGNYNEGNMKQDWNVYPLLIRDELTFDPGEIFLLRVGTDTELRWAKVKMKVPGDYGLEGEEWYYWSANDTMLTFKGTRFLAYPGLYSELELTAIPKTQVIYGVRGDYYSNVDRWGVDPRVAVRYEVYPGTTLKAGLGLFQQPPDMAIGDKEYGNPNLELTQAIHYSIGAEQRLFENLEVGVEGFYKDLRKVVRSSDEIVERDGEMVPERFNNDASGRVYGMELEIKHQPTNRFFGWLTYTLMRSERFDEPGAPARLFDYDQTHILNAMGTVRLRWGFEIGFRFRLVSGNPYTPIIGSSYDADSDMYIPIYGKLNSRRMPLFHQLDLRVDKKWQWKYLAFTLYLDVQNVYYHKNVEGYAYSYDYSERAGFQGIPILPSLGLKLEY